MINKAVQYIKSETDIAELFLLGSLCAVGLFNEYLCCFAAVILFCCLIYEVIKNKQLLFYVNLSSIAVAVVSLFYFLSVFWAVDKGEAFLGVFKFLPPALFMLIVMQKNREQERYLDLLPYLAVFMTVISTILSFIPATEGLVEIAGRLCGFFQYSNTFALFLLISFIVCALKEKIRFTDIICLAVILFGIIYSGSRTVFVLLVISIFAIIIFSKNKKLKISVAVLTVSAVLIAVILAVLTDNFYSIGRFLTISFKESTFVGRLLYYTDALPVILKHPFGMGYMGYYFTQQSFQSGVYSVLSVHNDFLQFMLDIGILPTLLLVGAIIKSFLSKGASLKKRLLLLVLCAHSCFDFDMQYVSIFMILVLLLNFKDGEEREFNINRNVFVPAYAVLGVLCLYIGIAQTFSFAGNYDVSAKMYPFKTRDSIMLLISETDVEKTEKLADKIIDQNGYVSVAYSAKGKIAFSKGDILTMIENKDKALETAVFQYDEYLDYSTMLIHAIDLYSKAGDTASVNFCVNKLKEVENKLNANSERLSYFGKMINDQPVTQFPEDIKNYIASLKTETGAFK